jgi:uncharacterized protein YceK
MGKAGVLAALAMGMVMAGSGCGSFVNLLPTGHYMHIQWTKEPRKIYGGVRWDGELVWSLLSDPPKVKWSEPSDFALLVGMGMYFTAVDLPLSAVFDTLTLYVTVPATYRRLTGDRPPSADAPQPESRSGEEEVRKDLVSKASDDDKPQP